VTLSPQQFWFAEAILVERFAEATKSFSPCRAGIPIMLVEAKFLKVETADLVMLILVSGKEKRPLK